MVDLVCAKVVEGLAALARPNRLDAGQLQQLAACFRFVSYPAGTQIFAAGDPASSLYFVCSGEVFIHYHPYDGGVLDIAAIPTGGAFGWSAALKRAVYTSTAIARTDVQALAAAAADLHRLMSTDSELSRRVLERATQTAGSRFDGLGREVIRRLLPRPSSQTE
jgi:CRP-like cAMP-binding protein